MSLDRVAKRRASSRARPKGAVRLCAKIVGFATLAGCTPHKDLSLTWINPRFEDAITADFGGAFSPRDFYRGDGLSVRLNAAHQPKELRERLGTDVAYMVSVPPTVPLALALREDPGLLAYFPAAEGELAHALVAVEDDQVLDGLAAAAHAAGGHACGALTRVDFELLTAVEPVVLPSVFAENLHLPSVDPLLQLPKAAKIAQSIATLEAMGTRHHNSTTGLAATAKVQELFEKAFADKVPGVTYEQEAHTATQQKSLIVAIPGTSDDATAVILGAHLDSINSKEASESAPGADDDASGIATLVEVARAIAESGAKFSRRIEFHAYAAEEVGLVGSDAIAKNYRGFARKVAGMLQVDMNAYTNQNAATIHLVTNDTNPSLRRAVKDLLHTYLGGDFVEKKLSGGTSDHRSWTNQGFAAVFPFEDPAAYNPNIHTSTDTSAKINALPMSERFAKMILAFLAHRAGLVAAAGEEASKREALRSAVSSDLRLAITLSKTDAGTFDVAVSAAQTVEAIEYCVATSAGALTCQARRYLAVEEREVGERRIFYPETAIALDDVVHMSVFAYDADQKLVGQRSVRLTKKL